MILDWVKVDIVNAERGAHQDWYPTYSLLIYLNSTTPHRPLKQLSHDKPPLHINIKWNQTKQWTNSLT